MSDTVPPPAAPPARRFPWAASIALLALAAAAAALGGGYYLWQLGEARQRETAAALAVAQRDAGELRGRLEALQGELERQTRQAAARQQLLEESLAELRTQSGARSRAGWALAEAEYLLRLGGHALATLGEPTVAAAALRQADQRLAELGGPAVAEVRALLAGEIAALRATPADPVTGLTHAVAAQIAAIPALPLQRPQPERAAAATPAAGEEWDWHTLAARAGAELKGLVTIRRDGTPPLPMLTVEQEWLVRQTLQLALEGARLALLRGDDGGYRDGLGEARGLLDRHFLATAAATRAMDEELSRLQTAALHPARPDLSGSLAALQRLNAAEAVAGSAAVAAPPPEAAAAAPVAGAVEGQ